MRRKKNVFNFRKLGEGAFGTVYGGECFFDEKGWVSQTNNVEPRLLLTELQNLKIKKIGWL